MASVASTQSQPVQGLRTANECCSSWARARCSCRSERPRERPQRAYIDGYLQRALAATDANDLIFYIDASRNYDPSPNLERITVPVLWINSADDFINPPELALPRLWRSGCRTAASS